MKAEILTIGDELLRGEILDSNKSFLAARLCELGVEAYRQTSIRDDLGELVDAFRCAAARSDLILVSGGLGPTRDDRTTESIAKAFGRKLVLDTASLREIEQYFVRRGRTMAESNAKQAYFPEGSEVLRNPLGTAPGFALQESKSWFFCMPGIPAELVKMMNESVVPQIEKRSDLRKEVSSTILLRTFGIGESSLEEALKDCFHGSGVTLGFRIAFPDLFLRLTAKGNEPAKVQAHLAQAQAVLRERLGAVLYGEEQEDLEKIVVNLLRESHQTLAVAESCTGGWIAQRLTAVAGASEVFLGGVVAYSNELKAKLLGVDPALLATHGAVSEAVARAMAEGACTRLGAELSVATTGIAGPTGGSAEKPVGFAYVAIARRGEATQVRSFCAELERNRHRLLTTQIALDGLRRRMLGFDWNLNRAGGISQPVD